MKNTTLVIASNKGGVDKTTLTIMNAIFLGTNFSKKVLVIDNDSQANTTISFGINEDDIDKSIYHMYASEIKDINEIIYKTEFENIDIIPATIELQRADNSIKNIISPNTQMADQLNPLKEIYDYILIDNGAFINTVFINSLLFADKILIPTRSEQYSEIGMNTVLDMIDTVNQSPFHKIEIAGIVQTFYENTNLHNSFRKDIKTDEKLSKYLLNTKIHKRVCVAEHFETNEKRRDLFTRTDSSSKKAIEEHLSLTKEVFNLE